jgi:hypothetical protein
LAEEEPDAAYLAGVAKRPQDAYVPEWCETYWRAWHALRFDRQYGAMGGESPISFASFDAYARRYEITGIQFDTFLVLVGAMDDEYLQHAARVAKESREIEERRREQT